MAYWEGTFGAARGLRLYYQGWLPSGRARGSVVLVHGLAEHSGRYGQLGLRLSSRGLAVLGFDLPGHGRSEGERLFVESFSEFIEALTLFISSVRTWFEERPLFLVGHSLGGLIAALYLAGKDKGVAGAVLSGPAVLPPPGVPAAAVLSGRILSLLFPRLGLIPLEVEGLSRDPEVVASYLADPLVTKGRIKARLGAEILSAMRELRRLAPRIETPLLILQGGEDRLVDPAGARLLYEGVASADKGLLVYEGLYHEVFNEPEKGRVLGDVVEWLEDHLG